MAHERVILVTGVAGYWGSRVAKRLSLEKNVHVIGLDRLEPVEATEGLDFIQADIRSRLLTDLLEAEQVDTVFHLQFAERAELSEKTSDLNVMGAMNLFGSCAKAGVKKIIVRSSTSVYGAHPDNSAFLTEGTPLRGSRRYGYTRDLLELEAFVNGFRRQSPGTKVVMLRFANIVGPTADSPMIRFLNVRMPIVLLGFDPLIQIIQEDDVVEALVYGLRSEVSGVYNIAAPGALPLSKVLRLVRKLPIRIFHPLAYKGIDLLRGTRFRDTRFRDTHFRDTRFRDTRFRDTRWRPLEYVPIELDYLRYSWIGDLSKMQDDMGFQPLYMADETLREFAGQRPHAEKDVQKSTSEDDDERLRDLIERRRRAKELASNGDVKE
jgi:UDP-glucose 4-epimerase